MSLAAVLAWPDYRHQWHPSLRVCALMMLLIAFQIFNEPPKSQQHHPNHRSQDHLRNRHGDKGSRNHYGDKLGYYIDNDGKLISPLNPEVYNSRVSEDEVILKAIKDNTESRYHELVNKNDGRDVEEELRVWIGEKMTKEGKTENQQGMVLDGSDDNNKKSSGDEERSEKEMDATTTTTTTDDQQKRSLDEPKKGQTTSILAAMASEGEMRELDELAVFHYPRNATGYYRGLWVRTPRNKTLYGDENKDAEDEQTTIEASHNVIIEEVHTWAQTQLHERKRDVSILFLPSNLYLESRRGHQKSYTSSSPTTTKPKPPPTLTLTRPRRLPTLLPTHPRHVPALHCRWTRQDL